MTTMKMNTDNHIITDEQLAAYISHKASPEETAIVEAWLATDPSHVDELLDITVASALPAVRTKVSSPLWYRRPIYWAAAAMVAGLLASTVFLWGRGGEQENGTLVAEVVEPVPFSLPEPQSQQQEEAIDKINIASQGTPLQREERVTASQSTAPVAEPVLEMAYPRRQREVCSAGQEITFRWQCNAAQLILSVTDDEGKTLLRVDVAGSEQYTITSDIIGECSELKWTITASFADGLSRQKTGIIMVVEN